jgi:general nucleoside transport system permease protein
VSSRLGRIQAAAGPRVIAVFGGLAVLAIVLAVSGYPLGRVFSGTVQGSLTAPGAWKSTMRWMIAYVVIGSGVLVTVRAGFLNLGAQGQFYLGATTSVWVALKWEHGPAALVIIASLIAGALAGMLWALVPGLLRVISGTDEVITTLMGNFLAVLWVRWVTNGPLKNPTGSGESTSTKSIAPRFRISSGTGVSFITISIAIVVIVATWVLVSRTRFGVLSGITGRNQVMAVWQGIDARRTGLLSFAVSGGAAGLAGAIEVLGPNGRVSSGFASDIGFTAILVAIIGGLSIIGLLLAALFFGALQAALLYLPIVTDLPPSALNLLRGTVALFITVGTIGGAITLRRKRPIGARPTGTRETTGESTVDPGGGPS